MHNNALVRTHSLSVICKKTINTVPECCAMGKDIDQNIG